MRDPQAITDHLLLARGGAPGEVDRLFALVYDELRELAAAWLRHERAGHTLQTTALVHEAYLKLVDQQRASWQDRAHFIAVAAEAIRRILIDHARGRLADKRGGGWRRVAIAEAAMTADRPPPDLLALDEALERLAQLHPRQAEVVKLRFFGGLDGEDAALVLGVDRATVVRDWTAARAWLLSQLAGDAT